MEEAIKEYDELVAKGQFQKAYDLATNTLEVHNQVEMLWRKAQVCFLFVYYVDTKPSKEVCEKYLTEGMNSAKRAVAVDKKHANSLTWYGILLDEVSNLKGIQERMKNVGELYVLWTKSQQIDPNNFLTESSLGIWHFIMTEFYNSKPEFFRNTNFTGNEFSYQKALEHMLKCESLAPGRSLITLEYLAKCYARLGDKDKAREVCQKVLNHPARHVEAQEAKKAADELLRQLKR
uniref:Regulator of microtubule dynamics protein 1 n=1 Tax=Trichobilharzia regenti TaxID=157069 RepID=A0AA85ITN9_TRIRE|nr:unnamed protein product [Trichobilharzia regenti]